MCRKLVKDFLTFSDFLETEAIASATETGRNGDENYKEVIDEDSLTGPRKSSWKSETSENHSNL
jgi:hypothetical protein